MGRDRDVTLNFSLLLKLSGCRVLSDSLEDEMMRKASDRVAAAAD